MIKIKTKLILAFLIIVFMCVAASLLISFTSYKIVVSEIIESVENNNQRITKINYIWIGSL